MAQYDINLREYWRILKKRKLMVIFTAIVLGAFSVAFAMLKAPAPIYTSVCSIKFERETTVEGLYARTITWSGGDDIETQISLIKSFSVLERVGERLGLIPKTTPASDSHQKLQVTQVVESLQAKVEVNREGTTNILNISVKDSDPAFTQRLANAIAVTYRDMHSENQMRRMTEAIKYIDDQLVTVRQKLKEAEEEFNRFSQENQLISIDLQSEKLLARNQEVKNEQRKLGETKAELLALTGRLDKFIKAPSSTDHNFFSVNSGPQYQAANDAFVGLVLKKDSLLEEYTPQHPEVVDMVRKIVEQGRKMKMLLEQQVKEIEKKETDAHEESQDLDKKINALMEKKLEFDRLKRKVELYHDMTTLLERKNQEAMIRKAEKPEEVSIVKPALLPAEPINPPRMTATGVVGILIGVVVGMLAAFVVETFDTSLGAIEEVEQTLKTPVLGVIPHGDLKDIEESLKERLPRDRVESASQQWVDLIAHFSPKSMISESFRGLRTNIQSRDTEGRTRTIAVTSASPQEGKTLVSINLAVTMAQAGLKILLVGSDMRKPALGKAFGVDNTPGLADILLGNYAWQDTVKTVTDVILGKMTLEEVMLTPGLDNLHIITGGPIPPNPAELIESKLLKDFIEEAKRQYDVILFDSPPILSTADAAILGSRVDGVLFVYRVGSVSRGLLKRSTTQLEQANCNILGVVLNGMKPEISPDFQDFKYYKYYHSYGEDRQKRGRSKQGFPFFGKRATRDKDWAVEIPLGITKKVKGSQRPKSARMQSSLLLLALVLLAGGILWQMGMIHPLEWVGLEKPAVKEAPKPAVQKPVPKAEPKPVAPSSPKPVTPKQGEVKGKTEEQKAEAKTAQVQPQPVAKEVKVPPKPPEPKSDATSEKTAVEVKDSKVQPQPSPTPPSKERVVAEPKAPLSGASTFPYSLYLGSSATLEQAKGAIENYSRRGLSAYWAKVDLDQKGTWFRIYLGCFKNPQEAERFAEENGMKESEVRKTEYANLIGVYAGNRELEEQTRKLTQLGLAPYTIKEHDGKSRLLVGAFITEAGAERQQRELKAHGIDSHIAQR